MGFLRLGFAFLAMVPVAATAAEFAPGQEVVFGVEAGYVSMSGHTSWVDDGYGKLRYVDDGAVFSRAFLDYNGRLTDTLKAHLVLEAYDDGVGSAIDYTEAYLTWRPVPRSPTRFRVKAGTFYPRISLENTAAGWSSPYTLNSSAINTWVAEELRNTGVELTISRRLANAQTVSAQVSAFVGNDPAGSLLTWKGWSVHDRQTRPSDDLPLPEVPQLVPPNGVFSHQDSYAEPLLELDDDIGYSVNLEWRIGKQLLVRAMHYNNRADPEVLEQGQYGWYTEFDHVGVQATLPGDIGVFMQWMDGVTFMGPWQGQWYPADVGYTAKYAMLTRRFERHRATVRYDHFRVDDFDELPLDNNNEKGHAWTLNYQFEVNDHVTFAVEWLSIKSNRPAWEYMGENASATERQLQVFARVNF